jgi:hypothetical protein
MLEVATLLTTSFIESENRMKHPQHTTSEQVGPTLPEIRRWHEELRELHARLRPHFVRPEVHQQALRYLQAVLSDVPRKNGWQLAEQAQQAHPYGMCHLTHNFAKTGKYASIRNSGEVMGQKVR